MNKLNSKIFKLIQIPYAKYKLTCKSFDVEIWLKWLLKENLWYNHHMLRKNYKKN